MVASTAILNRPAITPLCSFAKFSSSTKLHTFVPKFGKINVPKKIEFSLGKEIKYKMRRLSNYTTTYVFRDSSVEKGIGGHEQEAFRAKLAKFDMNCFEAFLDDLVSILLLVVYLSL